MRCLTCSDFSIIMSNYPALVKRHILIHALRDSNLNLLSQAQITPSGYGLYYANIHVIHDQTGQTYWCVVYSHNEYKFIKSDASQYTVTTWSFDNLKELYFYTVAQLQ